MKKLLLKLFPNYFNVTNVYDLDKIEVIGHPYRIAIVDKDTNKTFDALGIPSVRLEVIHKKIRTAMNNSNCKLQVMNEIEPSLKHINEFYAAVILLENITNTSGPGGFLGMLMSDMLKRRGEDPDSH